MKRHTGETLCRRMKSLLEQYDMASYKMHVEPANEFIVYGREATTCTSSAEASSSHRLIFKRRSYLASLFVCLPTHSGHSLSIYISAPPHAGKQKIDAISFYFVIMPMIGRCTDFLNSALPVLADALISRIKHCQR